MKSLEELTKSVIDLAGEDAQSTRKVKAFCELIKDVPIERIKEISIDWQQMDVGSADAGADYMPLPSLKLELFEPKDKPRFGGPHN